MSETCCRPIDTAALEGAQRRVLRIVLAINVGTFAMMLGAAAYGRSSALLSGALDNLGDALTYALSLAVVGASLPAKGRIALVKGLLILLAAVAVALQILWRLREPTLPMAEAIGAAATLNLIANVVCLRLLTPYRHGDVNLASAWECSRNDLFDGVAALVAAVGVWAFDAAWPDLAIAAVLLVLFLRSAGRVLRSGWQAHRSSRDHVRGIHGTP